MNIAQRASTCELWCNGFLAFNYISTPIFLALSETFSVGDNPTACCMASDVIKDYESYDNLEDLDNVPSQAR